MFTSSTDILHVQPTLRAIVYNFCVREELRGGHRSRASLTAVLYSCVYFSLPCIFCVSYFIIFVLDSLHFKTLY